MKRSFFALPLLLSFVFIPATGRADEPAKVPVETPKIPDISDFPVRELTLQELVYVNHLNEISVMWCSTVDPLSQGEKIEDNVKNADVLQKALVMASETKIKALNYRNIPDSFRIVNDYVCAGALNTYLGITEMRDAQKTADMESAKQTYVDGCVLFYKAAVMLRVATEKKPAAS